MRSQSWALTLFAVGVFMAALDNGIISAALTTLIYDFGVTANWGAWAVTIYTLGLAVSIPIVGKLSDKFGRKRLFLIEIFLFGLGSLLVAISSSFEMLLISRAIQSLGGGGLFIIASSHVLSTFPQESQGKALGMLGGMNGIGAVLGPNVGSFILDMTGGQWEWLFLINLPIAVVVLAAGWKLIAESRAEQAGRLDVVGAGLLAVAILSFMYGITNITGVNLLESLLDSTVYPYLAGGILLFGALLLYETRLMRRKGDPVLPIQLMGRPTYLLTVLLGMFSGAILASVIFLPAYVEQVLGVEASKAGYFYTPLALASGVGAAGGGALVDRRGPTVTMIIASILAVVGAALFPLWVTQTWQMFVASCILGVGFGIMLGAPINVLATEDTQDQKGVALGTISLFRQIGMTIAPAIYSGFIARAFLSIGDRIKERFEEQGMNVSGGQAGQLDQMADMSYQDMIAQVEAIPVPAVRDTILGAIQDAVTSGYAGLYWAAAAVSGLTLAVSLLLAAVRGRRPASAAEPAPAKPVG